MSKMTKENAIMFLEGWKYSMNNNGTPNNSIQYEAVDAALDALHGEKTEVCEEPNPTVAYATWVAGIPGNKKKYCSQCGNERPAIRANGRYYMWNSPFCPNCGMPMNEVKKNTNGI